MLEIPPHGILVWDDIFWFSNSEVPANHVPKSTTIHTHPLGRKRRGILPFLLRNNTESFSLSLCLSLCGLGGYGYFLARRDGHIMQLEWNQRLIQMQTELEFGIWDATRFQSPNPLVEWLKESRMVLILHLKKVSEFCWIRSCGSNLLHMLQNLDT